MKQTLLIIGLICTLVASAQKYYVETGKLIVTNKQDSIFNYKAVMSFALDKTYFVVTDFKKSQTFVCKFLSYKNGMTRFMLTSDENEKAILMLTDHYISLFKMDGDISIQSLFEIVERYE